MKIADIAPYASIAAALLLLYFFVWAPNNPTATTNTATTK